MKTLTKELQEAITPAMALKLLKEGNMRFVNNLKANRNLLQQANETSDGQHPFAVVLSCIDSRTSAELIFDQGLGDIFSVRIAGNIVNEDILGSMEFACKLAGSKIIIVLGHSNLTALLAKIRPAVDDEVETKNNRNSKNADFVENVASINVKRTVKAIMERSTILEHMIQNGEIGLIGGMHELSTGQVSFYEETNFLLK